MHQRHDGEADEPTERSLADRIQPLSPQAKAVIDHLVGAEPQPRINNTVAALVVGCLGTVASLAVYRWHGYHGDTALWSALGAFSAVVLREAFFPPTARARDAVLGVAGSFGVAAVAFGLGLTGEGAAWAMVAPALVGIAVELAR